MAGLLGKALAGAAAGGQQTITGLAFPEYLMKQRDELEKARAATLMQFQHQENEANRALTQQQITESGRHNVASETLTGQQITETGRHNVAGESETSRHDKALEQLQADSFRNAGLSIQQTEQGVMVVDAKNNKATPLTVNGKPLTSLKDTAATVTAVSNGIKSAIDMGDMERAKSLSDVLYNMVQGKTNKGGNAQPRATGPNYGTVVEGFKYIGKPTDNPNDQKNWQKVSPGATEKPATRGGLLNQGAQPTIANETGTRVSVPGMGMVNKADIPARLKQFMDLYTAAQKAGDTEKMVTIGKTIQDLREAQGRGGI